jgi:hypothetical protein
MLTLEELLSRLLTEMDPDDILTLLGITTEDLLDKFDYLIEERYEELNDEFE